MPVKLEEKIREDISEALELLEHKIRQTDSEATRIRLATVKELKPQLGMNLVRGSTGEFCVLKNAQNSTPDYHRNDHDARTKTKPKQRLERAR
jgi:hypothetical protein